MHKEVYPFLHLVQMSPLWESWHPSLETVLSSNKSYRQTCWKTTQNLLHGHPLISPFHSINHAATIQINLFHQIRGLCTNVINVVMTYQVQQNSIKVIQFFAFSHFYLTQYLLFQLFHFHPYQEDQMLHQQPSINHHLQCSFSYQASTKINWKFTEWKWMMENYLCMLLPCFILDLTNNFLIWHISWVTKNKLDRYDMKIRLYNI